MSMPRDYQRTKNNPYYLPGALYRRMLWLVRDYDRLKDKLDQILYDSPVPDGQPRGTEPSDSTLNKVIRREKLLPQVEAIEQALFMIPEEYRKGVINHTKYGERFPDTANIKTWVKWKSRFLYYLAERLGEI